MATFQLTGIPYEDFAPVFGRSDDELARLGVRRVIATSNAGFPCRVSLRDAEIGEELLQVPYEHHAVSSPYRAAGPIYVRRNAVQRVLPPGNVNEYVTRRLISVRAYDVDHMMVAAEVCEGTDVATLLDRQFADERVTYVHLHNARPGCFSCLAQRC